MPRKKKLTMNPTTEPMPENPSQPEPMPENPSQPEPIPEKNGDFLTVGEPIKETIQTLTEEYKQDKQEPETKRRKYTKRKKTVAEPEPEPETVVIIGKDIEPLIGFTLDFIAERAPVRIPPNVSEIQLISDATGKVLTKYFPDIQKLTPEILLIGSLVMFIMPRFTVPQVKRSDETSIKQTDGNENNTDIG